MFGIHDFGLFLVSALLLTLTPGQDTFYILGRSISQGRRAGMASVLGIGAGALVHTAAAALGLSAILAASATAFMAVKLLGALYLIYLGARMLFSRTSAAALPSDFKSISFGAIFRQGLITNLLNPKVALFFLSFLPQFVDPGSPQKFLALLTLGLCFDVIGLTWCVCLAWFSSILGEKLRGSTTFTEILNRTAGALFIGLGIKLAVSR